MSKIDEINLKNIFPSAFEEGSQDINREFSSEMKKLIEEEFLSAERTFVYIVERRALNLFRPFIHEIKKFHEIGTIRLYDDNKLAGIKEWTCNNGKECFILTDAIRKGDEISTIINSMNQSGITVLKVCGYLANKETIERLRSIYTATKFEFIHETIDYEQYKDYYGKIVGVHHLRLEPLDSEHPYHIYRVQPKTSRENIETVIFKLCSKANTYREQNLLNDDIIGYTAEFDGNYAFRSLAISTKNDFFEIERLQLRFRYDKSQSILRMMAFCGVCEFNLEKISSMDDYIEYFLPSFTQYCKLINDLPCNQKIICPSCLDVNLSLTFLDKFDYKIKKLSEKEHFNLINIKKFNPFFNF